MPTFAQNNPTGEKVVACVYGHKSPLTSGEAKVSIKDGKICQVGFSNYYPGGRGKLSFTCHLELNRNDAAYVWLDGPSGITITTKENGDALEVSLNRKGYLLNFANLKSLSKYCGSGAEVPEELLIPFSGKPCKARQAR